MQLVEIFLPLTDNEGRKQPAGLFEQVRQELADRFGGLTAFTRSPAKGLWQSEDNDRQQDDIVIYEVMTQTLDGEWWRDYKRELERRFRQEELVIRSHQVELIGS